MTSRRAVENDTDLETWAAVKSAAVPNEPVTAEQLRVHAEDGRLLLLAERGGEAVGCGIGVPSHFPGHAFLAARVLPAHRRAGIGTAIAAEQYSRSPLSSTAEALPRLCLRVARPWGVVGNTRIRQRRRTRKE